jgi:hypothetical protein
MSDPMEPPTTHPDELLAEFVQGTAPTADREAVEAHLATCGRCREEVELAHAARVALASLPQLGAPGLAAAGLDSFRRAALQPVPSVEADTPRQAIPRTPRTAPRARATPEVAPTPATTPVLARYRVQWGQLAAVAAVVVLLAGVVAIPMLLSKGGGSSKSLSGAPNAPAATSPPPALIDRGASYTTQDLDQLAASIALSRASAEGSGRGATRAPLVPTGPVVAADSGVTRTALDCVTSGAGLLPEDQAVPAYLEAADVAGTPAYVGAFQLPNVKLNLLLIAVSRDGCQPLYNVRQSI